MSYSVNIWEKLVFINVVVWKLTVYSLIECTYVRTVYKYTSIHILAV